MKKPPPTPAVRKGRPTAEESRQLDEQVKRTALALFLEHGYDGVTMEAVAGAAGITKRSLYARYKDKGELFSAAMKSVRNDWIARDVDGVVMARATLEEKLLSVAEFLMAHTLEPKYIKLARTLSSQAAQFPEEISQTYDISLSPRIRTVVKVLQAHRDEIAPAYLADVDDTAELFVGLVTGIPAKLAGYGTLRSKEQEDRRVALAVALFAQGIRR